MPVKLKCVLLEFLPFLYNFLYFNHEIFDIYKAIWFSSENCILETCHFLASLADFKNPKISWFIWQHISLWKFFHKLKSLRLLLGSGYLERFKSSMIFYKVSICPITLDFFSFFIPKKSKCIEYFCLGLIFTFSNLYLVLPHNLCNALNSSITTYLLSSIQRLLPCNRQDINKLDTYLLLYFVPAHYIFEGKGALDPRAPPFRVSPKRLCLDCRTTFFQIFCAKFHFFSDSHSILCLAFMPWNFFLF